MKAYEQMAKRIAALEARAPSDSWQLILIRPLAPSDKGRPVVRVTGPEGEVIERSENESESEFLTRAEAELRERYSETATVIMAFADCEPSKD
jgi:predicted esterase